MKINKVDLRKVNLSKSATWNIWKQLGVDLSKKTKRRIDVDKHFIPVEEQYKLVDYMKKNWRKLKEYKGYRKEAISKAISWEILCYFPRGLKKVRTNENK